MNCFLLKETYAGLRPENKSLGVWMTAIVSATAGDPRPKDGVDILNYINDEHVHQVDWLIQWLKTHHGLYF